MILVSDTRIMIVADFGVGAEEAAMAALKKSIEASGCYSVKVVDLPAIVRADHVGEVLADEKLIELSARKLEQISECDGLIWDGTDNVKLLTDKCRTIRLKCSNGSDHSGASDDTDTYDWGAPDIVVVFGKSAMLAGGLGEKHVLFINPEYDLEWPWKKQYYADQKLAGQYHCDKHDYERGFMETVLWEGTECTQPWRYSRRYGMETRKDYIGEFWNRYPGMAEIDHLLDGDTDALAKFICDFADDKLTYPLEEVYEAIGTLSGRDIPDPNTVYDFIESVKLDDITVLGLRLGMPLADGQSCYKLKVAEYDYDIPLEGVHTRRELNALRDTIIRVGERLKENEPVQKRILIVPDYFTPYNAPNVRELYDRLRDMGYYVAVYVHGSSLEKSRAGIERRCKVKPFDIIVTLETGCLVAGRVANCPRVMVNPDWATWEWMQLRLGEDKNRMEHRGIDNSGPFYAFYLDRGEVAAARHMAERSYIKRSDKPVYGWFTVDAVESHLHEEHLKRFSTNTYIPDLRLDTDAGVDILAQQIDNILTVNYNE